MAGCLSLYIYLVYTIENLICRIRLHTPKYSTHRTQYTQYIVHTHTVREVPNHQRGTRAYAKCVNSTIGRSNMIYRAHSASLLNAIEYGFRMRGILTRCVSSRSSRLCYERSMYILCISVYVYALEMCCCLCICRRWCW